MRPSGVAVYVRIVTPVGGARESGAFAVTGSVVRRFEGSGRARNLLAPVATPGDQLAAWVVGAVAGVQGVDQMEPDRQVEEPVLSASLR
jgi:hypothetical protein